MRHETVGVALRRLCGGLKRSGDLLLASLAQLLREAQAARVAERVRAVGAAAPLGRLGGAALAARLIRVRGGALFLKRESVSEPE